MLGSIQNLIEVKSVLQRFSKRVISRSRANLTRGKKNVNKTLWNSLGSKIKVSSDRFLVSFVMEDYGIFQDKGVKGANPSLVKGGIQKAPNAPFRFKTKMPPVDAIAQWAKDKRIRFRDEKGQFAKGTFRTIGFVFQKRIFAQGIKPSLFFTKPFESAFKDLPRELLKGLTKDIRNTFKISAR